MTFFVDANVSVYSVTQGPHREACAEAILAISRGQAAGLTSTAALEEVWFLEWSGKAGAIAGLTERAYAMTAPRSAAGEDLRELVRHGALILRGAGPATRYALSATSAASAGREGRGRPRTWTDQVIERELRTFIGGRHDWPSPAEFRSRGEGALYAAASRAGGIGRWRRLMGL